MTLQTVKLSELEPPSANPRRQIDASGLERLAQSLRTDGVLQNLVVAPARGKKFRIISGERRYRALQLLLECGDIDADYAVPVEVRKLAAGDAHRIATVENVQREALAPLDEAAAFAKFLRKNVALEEIAEQTGVTVRTIRQRLCLLDLHKDVQTALREARITLAQARALTCGTHEQQLGMLQALERDVAYTPEEIREHMLDDKPAVADALFDVAAYTGGFTSDLFAGDESTYFDDTEQFLTLQAEAVQALAEQKRQSGAAFVEITDGYRVETWRYREAEADEPGGVVINLAPSGRVDILENVVPASAAASAASAGERSSGPKPFYSAPLMRLMAHHKTLAAQRTLLDNPRLAREIACVELLSGGLLASRHEALQAFAVQGVSSADYAVLDSRATQLYAALRRAGLDLPELDPDSPAWTQLADPRGRVDAEVYNAVKALGEDDLDRLLTFGAAIAFGQSLCDRLDTDPDSLFNRVAADLGIDMRRHWRPDEAFLRRRSRAQLEQILRELGRSPSDCRHLTKQELVERLESNFLRAASEANPDEPDRLVNDWLPGAMRFPALDDGDNGEPASSPDA
jgi:ParB family chromosome partitioning protein